MKLTLAHVKRAAARFGATVERDDYHDSWALQVVAPAGKVWCEGPHCLKADCFPYDKPEERQAVYADLISRIEFGVEECNCPDCIEDTK